MHDENAFQPQEDANPATLLAAGQRAYDASDYAAARGHYEQALALSGTDKLAAASARRGLGATLLALGKYADGQALLEQALAARERILGADHPDTAQALNDLSIARFLQSDLVMARSLIERALGIRELALGGDHPDTIESLNDLAVIVNRQGDRERALAIHAEALARCTRALGDHRVTVAALNGLAVKLARDKRTYARARDLYRRALAMSERVLGPAHSTTAQLMNNLAAVLSDLGDDAEARAMLERSLALHEQIFGADHPNTAWVLINLGDIDRRGHNYATARVRYTRALIIREAALGALHPETVSALRKLVGILGDLGGQGDKSAMLAGMPLHTCLMALEAATGKLAPENHNMPGAHLPAERAAEQLRAQVARLAAELRDAPPTNEQHSTIARAADLERQASERAAAGDYAAARDLLERAIAAREQALGPAHIDLVEPLQALAALMPKIGRPSAVLPIQQRIADIHVQALGEKHPQTGLALSNLMGLVGNEYGPDAAAPLRERILRRFEDMLGSDDPNTRMMRASLERMQAMRPPQLPSAELPRQSRSEKREAALAQPNPLAEELLADVDALDWRGLRHAFGPAEDVPELLRMLLNEDEGVREYAFRKLHSNIWHQGTVYQASAHAVPFLLRMLADERTPDRLGVLHLLSALATGNSYLQVHHREDHEGSNWRKILAKKGEDFDTKLREELGWVRAANEAVAQGLDLFFALLENTNADLDLRQQALATIAVLPGRAAESVPRLRRLLPGTPEPPLRTGIVRALHDLMDDSRASRRFFETLLRAGENETVTLIAAVGVLTRAREQAPAETVSVVLNALRELGRLRHDVDAPAEDRAAWEAIVERYYPAWGADPLEFCLGGLRALRAEQGRAALQDTLRLLHDPEDAEDAAHALLDLLFNDGRRMYSGTATSYDKQTRRRKIDYFGAVKQPARQPHDLTAAQREALLALVDHDPLWDPQSNLLELYGLPCEREALRAAVLS